MSERVEVGYEELINAWSAWVQVRSLDVAAFRAFTGWGYAQHTPTVLLTPEHARRVRLLAGPHGVTLLAAHMIKEEAKHG